MLLGLLLTVLSLFYVTLFFMTLAESDYHIFDDTSWTDRFYFMRLISKHILSLVLATFSIAYF